MEFLLFFAASQAFWHVPVVESQPSVPVQVWTMLPLQSSTWCRSEEQTLPRPVPPPKPPRLRPAPSPPVLTGFWAPLPPWADVVDPPPSSSIVVLSAPQAIH